VVAGVEAVAASMIRHALITCSPDGHYIAFAHAKQIRLFNTRNSQFVHLARDGKDEPMHTGNVRVLKFDGQSLHLLSSGDDKNVFVWNCGSGKCIGRKAMNKKISAGQFGPNGKVIVADKTGDVYCLSFQSYSTKETKSNGSTGSDIAEMQSDFLLGHCATVTDVEIVKQGEKMLLATSDVEKKIRISQFPSCYEIVSFCFGHKAFISVLNRAAFKTEDGSSIPLILSGGGDGTVRIWEPKTGNLLDTYRGLIEMPASIDSKSVGGKRPRVDDESKEFQSSSDSGSAESQIVGGLTVSRWQNLTAVWTQGDKKIQFLKVNLGTLKPHCSIELEDMPVCMAFDPQARLWVVVLRSNKDIGVEVYGISEDQLTMKKLEVHESLRSKLFTTIDLDAQPLTFEFSEMTRPRKKPRVNDMLPNNQKV